MNNCYCNTISGGYMFFENFGFVTENFGVVKPWATASAVAEMTAAVVFVWAIVSWNHYQHLWFTRKRAQIFPGLHSLVHANMDWLV